LGNAYSMKVLLHCIPFCVLKYKQNKMFGASFNSERAEDIMLVNATEMCIFNMPIVCENQSNGFGMNIHANRLWKIYSMYGSKLRYTDSDYPFGIFKLFLVIWRYLGISCSCTERDSNNEGSFLTTISNLLN